MLFFLSLASAADLTGRPLRAEVTLPAAGSAAIKVPIGLRWADEPSDGSDLLLVDAAGNEVPFAVVRGGSPNVSVDVEFRATIDSGEYEVLPSGEIDGLRVMIPWGTSAS